MSVIPLNLFFGVFIFLNKKDAEAFLLRVLILLFPKEWMLHHIRLERKQDALVIIPRIIMFAMFII